MSAGAAAQYGLHLGSTLPVAFFTDAQAGQPNFSGYPQDKPHLIVPFKLVGIVEWDTQVVQDDDAALGNQIAVITPALTRQLETCCAYYSYVSFHLDGGLAHEAAVVSAVNKVIPNLGPVGGWTTNAPYVAKAERAIRPEAIALGVFGLVAALAALVISGQVISRLIRRNATEGAIVRALGAGPAMAMADGLAGVARRDRGRVAPGGRGRRRTVPSRPDRPGPARLPRHRRRLRLDRPRVRVPACSSWCSRRPRSFVAYRVAPHRVGVEAGHPRPRRRVEPGRGVGRAAAERGPRHPIGPGRACRARRRAGALRAARCGARRRR